MHDEPADPRDPLDGLLALARPEPPAGLAGVIGQAVRRGPVRRRVVLWSAVAVVVAAAAVLVLRPARDPMPVAVRAAPVVAERAVVPPASAVSDASDAGAPAVAQPLLRRAPTPVASPAVDPDAVSDQQLEEILASKQRRHKRVVDSDTLRLAVDESRSAVLTPVPVPETSPARSSGTPGERKIDEVLEAKQLHALALQQCAEQAFKMNPDLKGEGARFEVALTILASGAVTAVTVKGPDRGLAECLRQRVSSWTFTPATDDLTTQISLIFN